MKALVRLTGPPSKAVLVLCCLAAATAASPYFDTGRSRPQASTEVPELRTPTSRTYSNCDGTFTAEIRPAAVPASSRASAAFGSRNGSDSLAVSGTGYVYHYQLHGFYYYYKYGPDMSYRWIGLYEEAWAKFDLSSIPDDSRVLYASLHWYQYEIYSYNIGAVLTQVNCDPDSASGEALFHAIRYGTFLSGSESCNGIGWKERELNDLGRQHVASCLDQDWVALGISERNEAEGGHGYGTEGGDLAPYLRIEYASSGTHEAHGTPTRRWDLAFAPNPGTGLSVTALHNIAASTSGNLTLRDVLGRIAESFTLDPSGRTRLDLRGLAPGVYMATLDGTMPLVSRKLVITAR